jgi:hypothetical protein
VGAGVLARELATDSSTGMDGASAMLDAATGFFEFAGSMVLWMTGLTLGSVSAVQLQSHCFPCLIVQQLSTLLHAKRGTNE